jgi:hypothetical protein
MTSSQVILVFTGSLRTISVPLLTTLAFHIDQIPDLLGPVGVQVRNS